MLEVIIVLNCFYFVALFLCTIQRCTWVQNLRKTSRSVSGHYAGCSVHCC